MKRLFLALFCCLLFTTPVAAKSWPKVYTHVWLQHVVMVEIGESGICTAVVVRPHVALTAAHCFHSFADIFLVSNIRERALMLAIDFEADLALLQAPLSTKAPIPLAPHSPPLGTEVAALGYHLTTTRPDMTLSHIFQLSNLALYVDRPYQTGYSGGPLVNSKGQLVGINIRSNRRESLGHSVSIEAVRMFLADHLQ